MRLVLVGNSCVETHKGVGIPELTIGTQERDHLEVDQEERGPLRRQGELALQQKSFAEVARRCIAATMGL